MKELPIKFVTVRLAVYLLLLLPAGVVAQQVSDPDFDTKVARPAFTKGGPEVLIDEAHYNFHTAGGRYKPFADLITNDGFKVTPGKVKFTAEALRGYRVLVVSNATGADGQKSPEWSLGWFQGAAKPAFDEAECEAVRNWVKDGGALLLIADHKPFGSAAEVLTKGFGVEVSKGYVFPQKGDYRTDLTFTRETGGVAEHPITRGRDKIEEVNRVMTFVGQSLKGPVGSAAFIKLSDTAIDRSDLSTLGTEVSAAGRAQGLALKYGKGRVVVLGEAAMITAQLGLGGKKVEKFGMNVPDIDNKQLALNIMHWLGGLLD